MEAAESIDYSVYPDYRTHYTQHKNKPVRLVDCPYFTTSVYDIEQTVSVEAALKDSFVILIGLKGEGQLATANEQSPFAAGETILIPAKNRLIKVSGKMKFLEVHIDNSSFASSEVKELKELSLPTVAEELRQQSFWRIFFKQQDIRLNSLTSLTPLTS